MPLSWSKLDRIQTWIDGNGPSRWPDALPGAELELAQGRLALATQESNSLPESIINARLDRAESGFERVLSHSSTSSVQRREASSGLTEVRSRRRGEGVVVPSGGIIPRSSWGARSPNTASLSANRQAWKRITIHHSSTSVPGSDLGSSARAIQKIQKEHMARPAAPGSRQKWGDIGYHFLIDESGRVFQGRSLSWRGAHAGNSITNEANIGICMLGNFNSELPSRAAMASMEKLIRELSKRNHIGQNQVYGHLDFKATECPGRKLMSWVTNYSH